jgi:hypothetical protein
VSLRTSASSRHFLQGAPRRGDLKLGIKGSIVNALAANKSQEKSLEVFQEGRRMVRPAE